MSPTEPHSPTSSHGDDARGVGDHDENDGAGGVTERSHERQRSLDATLPPTQDQLDVGMAQKVDALTATVNNLASVVAHLSTAQALAPDPKADSHSRGRSRDRDEARRISTNKLMNDIPRNTHRLFSSDVPRCLASDDEGESDEHVTVAQPDRGRRITDPFYRAPPTFGDGLVHDVPKRPTLQCSATIAGGHSVPSIRDLVTFKDKVEDYRNHHGVDSLRQMMPENFIIGLEARYSALNKARVNDNLRTADYERLLLDCILARMRPQSRSEAITHAREIKMASCTEPSMDKLITYTRSWLHFVDLIRDMDIEQRVDKKTIIKEFLANLEPESIREEFRDRNTASRFTSLTQLAEDVRLHTFSLEEKSRAVAPFYPAIAKAQGSSRSSSKKDKKRDKSADKNSRGTPPRCKIKKCTKQCRWNQRDNDWYKYCGKECHHKAEPPPGSVPGAPRVMALQPKPKPKAAAPSGTVSNQCARPGCTKPKAPRPGGFHAHCSISCRDANIGAMSNPLMPNAQQGVNCYRCGQPGHISKDCKGSQQLSQLQHLTLQAADGQLYTLTPSQTGGGGTALSAGSTTPNQFFGLGAGGAALLPPTTNSVLSLTPPASVASVDTRVQELEARNSQLQAQLHQSAAQMSAYAQSMSMASHGSSSGTSG
jgi:hypothetical protein